jgi:hypothetical protein
MATQAPIAEIESLVDRLIAERETGAPFVSLYLDARPDGQGKRRMEPNLSKDLAARGQALPADQRGRYQADAERILTWVRDSLPRSARAAACFACADAGVFEAVALDTPIDGHQLHVGPRPHVYPLMHLLDRYRRYAAVVADTSYTRIFVFGLNRRLAETDVEGAPKKTMDGFSNSEARFQRHVAHVQHRFAKEVGERLEKIIREERIEAVVLAGDEVALPLIRAALPAPVQAKVIEQMHLDVRAPEHQVLQATLAAFQRHDAEGDAARVQRLLDEFRAGGLGIVGVTDTRLALEMGQVDELLIAADPTAVAAEGARDGAADPGGSVAIAEDLVERARRTDAKVSFIEDPTLLRDVGGVGGLLRFRIAPRGEGSTPS